jgi:hypothetical protein
MMFSRDFFSLLITLALVLTGAGALTLIGLWIRDVIKGKVW